jgi:hypothetical protein
MTISQSIEQLENDYWEDIIFSTGLAERCYKYRKLPIADLTPEQLRTLIGQQIGLKYLIPVALKVLERNILAEGDYYEGDLLSSVLSVDVSFWSKHPDLKLETQQLIRDKRQVIEQLDDGGQVRRLLRMADAFIVL